MGRNPLDRRAAALLVAALIVLPAGACSDDHSPAPTSDATKNTAPAPSTATTPPPPVAQTTSAPTTTAATAPPAGTTVRVPPLPPDATLDDAVALLAERGLAAQVPAVGGLSSTNRGPARIRTRPAAGTAVPSGSSVRLRFVGGRSGSPSCRPGRASLPDVVALSLADAVDALDEAGFAWHTSRLAALPADPARSGYLTSYTVVAQKPEPGLRERCGTDVLLTVRATPAAGSTLVPRVPPHATVDRALLLLRRAGLASATGPLDPVSSMADVIVLGTQPRAGRTVPSGSAVTLALGEGLLGSPGCSLDEPPPVPDVVGRSLADVDAMWTVEGGLPALPPDAERASYLGSFTVTGQSPVAGSPGLPCAGPPLVVTVVPNDPA